MSDFLSKILPVTAEPPKLAAPRTLLIYSDFKVGKSAISSWLQQNRRALWLDYEGGSLMYPQGQSVEGGVVLDVPGAAKTAGMKRIDFLLKLWKELAEEPVPRFDYILHDKIDNLEEWAERWATAYYKNSIIGRNFNGSTVLELAEGGGYLYLRERFLDLWNAALAAAPRQVFWATLRTKYSGKGDTLVDSKELDLTGKVRKIAAGFCDAPGYMWRAADGSNRVSFKTAEKGTFCGNRFAYLEGQEIKLSWKDGEGKVIVDWKVLYPDGK